MPNTTDKEEGLVFEPGEFHIIEYVNMLLKRRWLIIIGAFICVVFAGIYFKMQPPVYTASARFLPSREQDMTSRMGTIIGSGGRVESLEGGTRADYYPMLLGSRPFLERMAQKKFFSKKWGAEVDLTAYYKIEGNSETEKSRRTADVISRVLTVNVGRLSGAQPNPAITISYFTNEPELSAVIVNAFLDEIILYNQNIRDTKAKQNRVFIENQLRETQDLLKKAEAELANFTSRNIKIVTPELQVEKDRLKRAVTVQEEVFIELKKQLELAKIEEQEKKPSIEIIERAAPPLFKSAPKVRKNVKIAGFLGLVFFCALAIGLDYISKINPEEERTKEFLKYIKDIEGDIRKAGRVVGLGKKKKKGSPTKPL